MRCHKPLPRKLLVLPRRILIHCWNLLAASSTVYRHAQMPMSLFDTHLHLDDEQFDGQRDTIVQRAIEAGVETMVLWDMIAVK